MYPSSCCPVRFAPSVYSVGMKIKNLHAWVLPAFIISLLFNIFLLTRSHFPVPGVKVIGVIDGDTIVLEGKSRVRLRYVDAPEKELCGYSEASKLLGQLTLGKSVRIEETLDEEMDEKLS